MKVSHTNEVKRVTMKLLEWLQEFQENLVDELVPERRGARVPVPSDSHASSSHETT